MAAEQPAHDSPVDGDDSLEGGSNLAPKRTRWATQRHPGESGKSKRSSILKRLSQRVPGKHAKPEAENGDDQTSEEAGPGRRLFFNIPLPDSARDHLGHPLVNYPRNKIRTAKYTPLSFIPKNLFLQFHNIANIYFLFINIIGVSLYRLFTLTAVSQIRGPKLTIASSLQSSELTIQSLPVCRLLSS